MINQMLMILAIVLVVDVIALDNNQQTGVVCSAEDDNLTNTIISQKALLVMLVNLLGLDKLFLYAGPKTMMILVVSTMIMMLLSNL